MLYALAVVVFATVVVQVAVLAALARLRAAPTHPGADSPAVPDAPGVGPRSARGRAWEELKGIDVRLTRLEVFCAGMPGLWREEADRAQRAEDRARKFAVGNRKKRASETDEESELSLIDAQGGGEPGVLPMRQGVASPTPHEAVIAAARRQIAAESFGTVKAR